MKIYCCQFDIAWEDKTANFETVRNLFADAKPASGSLVLLPEMFATGFSMNVADIAEERLDGPTLHFLSQCAEEFGIYLIGGFVSSGAGGKGHNQLAIFGPGGQRVADYVKIHPFSYGEESRYYAGGGRICQFAWAGANVSPFICYDLRFPEIFRIAVRDGTEIFTVIANWPQARQPHWLVLLRARAIENQAYVAAVNRIGSDPRLAYGGRSQIIDPRGEILADAGEGAGVINAEINLPELRKYRADFPVLTDMRGEFLGPRQSW
jgi:omega-amidase